jgi:DNA repair ATPase RecN
MDAFLNEAVGRTKDAIKRKQERARQAEVEKIGSDADEALIAKAQIRLRIVSRLHGAEADQIIQAERDIHVAEAQIAEMTGSIARLKIQLAEHQREIAPLAKELTELRELLSGLAD